MKMTKQEVQDILHKMPFLYPRNVWTGEKLSLEDYNYEDIPDMEDLPEGWHRLFLQCCEDLVEPLKRNNQLDTFYFTQTKEKYGSMRMYHNGVSQEAQTILDKYEYLSTITCCVCGKPATKLSLGWICPYCNDHFNSTWGSEKVTPDLTFKVVSYWEGQKQEVLVDCTEEWNRYLQSMKGTEGEYYRW